MGHSAPDSQQIIVALAKFDLLVFTLEKLCLGLTTYSGGRNTGHVMVDALDWTQRQRAGAIENYIIPGDHRRVKRSPVLGPLNPFSFSAGKAGLFFSVPVATKKNILSPSPKSPFGLKKTKFVLKPVSLASIAAG